VPSSTLTKEKIPLEDRIQAEINLRKQVEHDLNLRLRQQEAIAWFGEYANSTNDLEALMRMAVQSTQDTLEVDLSKILELLPDEEHFLVKIGIGLKDGISGKTVIDAGKDSHAGYTLLTSEPVIAEDLHNETRFHGSPLLFDHQMVSGISVIIPGKGRPYGVLTGHTRSPRKFSENDARFLKSIANILAATIQRIRIEEELRNSRDELAVILSGISEGVIARSENGRNIYANRAAAQIIGLTSVEELLNTPFEQISKRLQISDEFGKPYAHDALPGLLALKGVKSNSIRLRFRTLDTGEERWTIMDATPVRDRSGKVLLAVSIFRDITDLVLTEQSQKLLGEASSLLSSSLDYQDTLANIARLSVNYLADWCMIHLVDRDGQVNQIAVAHKDPEKLEIATELQKHYKPGKNADTGLEKVLKTGKAEYYPTIPAELLYKDLSSSEQIGTLKALGLKSAMIVPLIARGRTMGAISLIWSESGRTYKQQDVFIVNELARRAAIAIDNAALFQEAQRLNAELEMRVAKRTEQLQKSNALLENEVDERKKAEAALRKSETLLNSLFQSAPDATVIVNLQGKIVRVNAQAQAIFGYKAEELLGKSIEVLLPGRYHPRHEQHRTNFFGRMSTRPMGAGLELHAVRKDGSEFPVDVMLSPVKTEEGEMVIGAVRDITEQKKLQAELAETHRRLFDSIEAERINLSQELHDGPIQELYGVVFSLTSLENNTSFTLKNDDNNHLTEAKDSINRTVQILRSICGELRPPSLIHFGLKKAIQSHIKNISDVHPELNITLELDNDGRKIPDHIQLSLFRVYQNSISNIVRHAEAKNVNIRFIIDDIQVLLEISDDGCGFVVPEKWVDLARAGHFGLVGTAERVEAIGGTLDVQSGPGKGTTVRVSVPRGGP
jgi:PAS domain S-box-containing protein